jgi:hypothetical protein
MVPMADQSRTIRIKNVHTAMGLNGGPAKTGRAKRVVTAKGQMRLGRVFLLKAAMMHVTNAIAAPKGKRRMIEKSTPPHYPSIRLKSTQFQSCAGRGRVPGIGQAAVYSNRAIPGVLTADR